MSLEAPEGVRFIVRSRIPSPDGRRPEALAAARRSTPRAANMTDPG